MDLPLRLSDPGAMTVERAGPKAATLARLRDVGLPVPDGIVVPAELYRGALAAAGVAAAAARVAGADEAAARRLAVEVRLGLLGAPLADFPVPDGLLAVRSSALAEADARASLPGQLETFLGVAGVDEVRTAVRACWASLWLSRTARYLRERGVDPAGTAVAVLVQRLVSARAAGGALSRTADSRLVLTAAWGLGAAVAQGEVVPDRYVLTRDEPALERVTPGRKSRQLVCAPGDGPRWDPVSAEVAAAPCLAAAEAVGLARLVLEAEAALGSPVEVEWALDERGFQLLQARPLAGATSADAERVPGVDALSGQPAGAGRAVGPVRLVRREADLDRVGIGDVLVTRVAGPALAPVLPRVAAVVAELGGSTSHLAALARERGIPAVLGVADATRRLAEGSRVLVDGGAGLVHALS